MLLRNQYRVLDAQFVAQPSSLIKLAENNEDCRCHHDLNYEMSTGNQLQGHSEVFLSASRWNGAAPTFHFSESSLND